MEFDDWNCEDSTIEIMIEERQLFKAKAICPTTIWIFMNFIEFLTKTSKCRA